MKSPRSISSFNGVAAGQTATLDLAATGTYHGLLLSYQTATAGGATKANMEAELTEFRLKVNGKVQRRFTAEELFDLNELKGQAVTVGDASNPGHPEIFFAEPWRRAAQGEDALAWGMGDVDTFTLEVDIASGAGSPSLSARALWTPDSRPMGPIVKWRKHTVPVTATGIVNVTTLPKIDAYYALHAKSANIADVEVQLDQLEVFKATARENNIWLGNGGRSPVSGWFHVCADFTNRAGDVFAMVKPNGDRVKEFRVDFNMSSAASFTLLTESIGLRD